MKQPTPRTVEYMGTCRLPTYGDRDTWIEPEVAAYRTGGSNRRCRAINRETKELVVVLCGIADTMFSIPCKKGGFVTFEDNVFWFNPEKR